MVLGPRKEKYSENGLKPIQQQFSAHSNRSFPTYVWMVRFQWWFSISAEPGFVMFV